MENSGRRVMYRNVTPRPMPVSANLYDRFACAPKTASGSALAAFGS
jgi:hypothetical protein